MKSSIIKRTILLASAVFFSILACKGQNNPSEHVAGTWTKSMGQGTATFILTTDNKYEVWFTGGEEADVWGSYKINGVQITFTDEGGQYGSDSSGFYEFRAGEDSLSFTKVNDPVDGRSMLVEGSWSKASEE